MANCVIFHTALDMTAVIRQLAEEGWVITPSDLAALSPYITEAIKRFGEYATDGLTDPPAAFNPASSSPPTPPAKGPTPTRPPAPDELPKRGNDGAA